MPITTPKSESVTEEGQADGWTPSPGFLRDLDLSGHARLVVSVPIQGLCDLHVTLASVLGDPVSVLYRQVVDRADPKPAGSPPRDFVALEVPAARVAAALRKYTDLIHHDARCEFWLRGALHDQVVLDADGMLFCYPDDPAFEDVLRGEGMPGELGQTIVDRDYAKHWFHAENDALEAALFAELGMVEVPHRG